jgi:hypothetical protein
MERKKTSIVAIATRMDVVVGDEQKSVHEA